MGAVANAALALLVLGLVLAAAAGPRAALASRTTALRQTLSATSPLTQTMTATTTWDAVTAAMQGAGNGQIAGGLTTAQVGEITSQLRGEFGRRVPLGPASQDWAAVTSAPHAVRTDLPATRGIAVRLEIAYRQPLTPHLRLVSGGYPAVTGPASAPNGTGSAKAPLQVMISQATAAQFGLGPGDRLTVTGQQDASGSTSKASLEIAGIVAPRDPSSAFWIADPAVLTPDLEMPSPNAPRFWVAEVIAGAGELSTLQSLFGPGGLTMTWQLPLDFLFLSGQQSPAYYSALNRLNTQTPVLAGDVAPAGSVLQVTAGPLQAVAAYLATASSVDVLLWLLYASLAVAAIVVLLLAARMVTMRRSAELTLRRARGASLARIAVTAAAGTALACVPGALAGGALAVLLVPGQQPAGGWSLPAGAVAVAVAAPALLAAWQHRLSRRRAGGPGRGRPRATVRLVAELTAAAAAIAGIVVFRQQGTAPGAGVNLYTSAAPVLVAIPAVIVVLRLYPLVLRALLRLSARRRGAIAFLGVARAARVTLTPALPAFALVLALGVAAFAGTVRDAVTGGESVASWQAAGADVTISPVPAANLARSASTVGGGGITPAARRAVAAVRGVTHLAGVFSAVWTTPDGQQITGIAVDPAQYAALTAATQTFPPVPAASLAPGTPQPVLASPQAAAELGRGTSLISTLVSVSPVRIRVAGLLSGTPALPGGATSGPPGGGTTGPPSGGAFVVLPLAALHPQSGAGPVEVNELLLTGSGIDRARLTTALRETMPGAVTSYRSDILDALAGAPLQHGAFELFELALVAAAALGLSVMLLEIALGSAERESTLARLATMGIDERQRAGVVAWEVLPPVLAAAVAALACALVLPWVLRPAVDLSVFTRNASVTAPLSPSAGAVLLPLAALIVVAFAALLAELRRGRRGVAASLRAGE
jgi:putative ABC transport system permease protein